MSAAEAFDAALLSLAERGEQPPCFGLPGHVSDDPHERQIAARLCDGCPVRDLCGAVADERKEAFGVWAGRDRTPRTYKQRESA